MQYHDPTYNSLQQKVFSTLLFTVLLNLGRRSCMQQLTVQSCGHACRLCSLHCSTCQWQCSQSTSQSAPCSSSLWCVPLCLARARPLQCAQSHVPETMQPPLGKSMDKKTVSISGCKKSLSLCFAKSTSELHKEFTRGTSVNAYTCHNQSTRPTMHFAQCRLMRTGPS